MQLVLARFTPMLCVYALPSSNEVLRSLLCQSSASVLSLSLWLVPCVLGRLLSASVVGAVMDGGMASPMLRRALFALLVASHVFFFFLVLFQYDQLSGLLHGRSEAVDTASSTLSHSINSIASSRALRVAKHYTASSSFPSAFSSLTSSPSVALPSSSAELLSASTSAPLSPTSIPARASPRPSASSAAVPSLSTASVRNTSIAAHNTSSGGRAGSAAPVLLLSLVPLAGPSDEVSVRIALPGASLVHSVSVHVDNRSMWLGQSDLDVRVGNDSSAVWANPVCAHHTVPPARSSLLLHCTRPLVGSYVYLHLPGRQRQLIVRRIQVFGYDATSSPAANDDDKQRTKRRTKPSSPPPSSPSTSKQCPSTWLNESMLASLYSESAVDLLSTWQRVVRDSLQPWLLPKAAPSQYMLGPQDMLAALSAFRSSCALHRLQWNTRRWAKGAWQKSGRSVTVADLTWSSACGAEVPQRQRLFMEHVVQHAAPGTLPEYMDVLLSYGDGPQMPVELVHVKHNLNDNSSTNSPAPLRFSSLLSSRPQQTRSLWTEHWNVDLRTATLDGRLPLQSVPPPFLSWCSSRQHADISWFYREKLLTERPSVFVHKLTVHHWELFQSVVGCTDCDKCRALFVRSLRSPSLYRLLRPYRRSQAVWRGGATGDYWKPNSWQHKPRAQFVNQSRLNPQLMDFRLTKTVTCVASQCEQVKEELQQSFGDRVGAAALKWESYLQYAAVGDVDGTSWSSRFYQLLASGAVVLKQRTPFTEFWYDAGLQSGAHYFEFKEDSSDLPALASRLLADDDDAAELAAAVQHRAISYVANYLSQESLLLYAVTLLSAYSELLITPWSPEGAIISQPQSAQGGHTSSSSKSHSKGDLR